MPKPAFYFAILIAFGCSGFISGCGSKKREADKYELSPPTKDGGVYRINKESGEVRFILAQTSMIVQGTEIVVAKTNRVMDWGQIQSGDLKCELKTSWRDGKLRYKFYVSPADRIPIMSREKLSNATFHILFYDRDGFQLLGIPVKLEEMQQVPSTFTPNPLLPKLPEQVKSIFESGSMNCDLNTYESVGNWSLGRSGF